MRYFVLTEISSGIKLLTSRETWSETCNEEMICKSSLISVPWNTCNKKTANIVHIKPQNVYCTVSSCKPLAILVVHEDTQHQANCCLFCDEL